MTWLKYGDIINKCVTFFRGLFTSEGRLERDQVLQAVPTLVDDAMKTKLIKKVTEKEVYETVF